MTNKLLVRGARQLLTIRGPSGPRRGEALRDLGLIEDGAVLIIDGVIDNVGPTRRVENLAEARGARELDVSGHVVMPGFVDSHTHLIAPPPRFVNNPASASATMHPSSPEFASVIQHMRNATPGPLEFQARRYLDAALRHGTTTMEVKSGMALSTAGELKLLRVIAHLSNGPVAVVPTFFGAQAIPPEYCGDADAYLSMLCTDLLPKVQSRRLAFFADVFCDASAFTPEQSRRYLHCARDYGFRTKIHAEINSRLGVVAMALQSGVVSVDGLNYAQPEDASLLARSQAVATLLPGFVHADAGRRLPPARLLIDSGAAVALASSFLPTVNSTYNMQMIVSLACAHLGMTAEEAICAATINGAYALGRAQTCGSLESGKSGDLLVLAVPDYREIPLHFGSSVVSIAMRGGEIVYRQES
jgi:imidazolonepropionase